VGALTGKMEHLVSQGEELSRQLEDDDPSESLRVQAEVDTLKVGGGTGSGWVGDGAIYICETFIKI